MKSGMGKLLTLIMAAFLLVFAGYHAYRHFFSGYTTENVYRYTVYHSTTAQGVFFREEKAWTRPRAATCAMRCVMAKRCGWAACWPIGTAMP